MRFFTFIFISTLSLFGALTVRSEQPVIEVNARRCNDKETVLSTELLFFSGHSSLSFEEIKNLPEDRFHIYQNEKLHKDSTYWLKLTIKNYDSISDEYVLHFNDLISHIELYQVITDSVFKKEKGGILVPLSERSLKGSIKDKVPFWLFENQETILFLKIRNQLGNVNILGNMKITSETAFEEDKADLNFIQGGFLGILLLLFTFNFILFIFSRNPLYLYYSLYILFFMLFFANILQLTERFLLYNHPRIDIYTQWAYLIAQFIYLLFFIELLKIEKLVSWRKYLIIYGYFLFAYLLLTFGISLFDYRIAMVLCDCYSIINVCFIVFSFITLHRKTKLTTKLILVGSLCTVLGALTTIILSFSESFIANLFYFQIGVFIEMLLFTIAINYTYTKELQNKQVLITEKESENKTLKNEIYDKNLDLTTKTLIIQEKENLLSNLIYQLSELNESDKTSSTIRNLISSLKHNLSNTPWSEVELHFNKVHPQFYAALQEKCPTLTTNERKLCAFLKFNLSTKEIAAITGKSVNTIDVSRSRLRKKIGLDNSENLQTFIANIC